MPNPKRRLIDANRLAADLRSRAKTATDSHQAYWLLWVCRHIETIPSPTSLLDFRNPGWEQRKDDSND